MSKQQKPGAVIILALLMYLLAPAAPGAIPDGIDYQGYLTNTDGSAVNADISMSFVAYNADFGGAPLWNQTATVTVEQGLFNVTLGSPVNPFPAGLFDGTVYIGLFVAGEELLPRRMLSSAGYAFKASDADSLGGSLPAAFNQSAHVVDMSNPHGVTAAQSGAASIAALASLTGDVTTLGQDIAAVDSNVSANTADIAALLATVNSLQATVVSLQADLSTANATIANLQSEVTAIQGNSVLALDNVLTLDGGETALFAGVNVQVVNGTGNTDGTPNGKGNVIVGYNSGNFLADNICSLGEYPDTANCLANGGVWSQVHKSGSHNVVIGSGHNYSRTSGLVIGHGNSITGEYSSVTVGIGNLAAGQYSSVSGGINNSATGQYSSVSGGYENFATRAYSSVSGGRLNTAGGFASSVSGGRNNMATGDYASVSGGGGLAGEGNVASGDYSSVSAGRANSATNLFASVGGGINNSATGANSSVSGGSQNLASGTASSVSGGGGNAVSEGNIASGPYSSIGGGAESEASGDTASISGGWKNVADGERASVSGGVRNEANARWSTVSGGADRISNGEADWRAGTLFENF